MREVFNKKKEAVKAHLDVANTIGLRYIRGDVGLEVEVEGNKFPKTAQGNPAGIDVSPELIPKSWCYHHDGSLRGADNAEYTLRVPISFAVVPDVVNELYEMFSKFGTVLDDSNRTSVHVHFNVQKFHLDRLCTLMAMYFSLEEILTAYSGEHRVGNLFCLRVKDASAIVSHAKAFVRRDMDYSFHDGLHYSGLNLRALQKFGSLEFRSFRGTTNPQDIIDWVAILQRLYEKSDEYTDPRQLIEGFSGEGPMAYFDRLLGDKASLVLRSVPMTTQEVMSSIYEGIRYAQDLCYCRDWSDYKKTDVAPDPFKRPLKKVSSSLLGGGGEVWVTSSPQNHPYMVSALPSQTVSPPEEMTDYQLAAYIAELNDDEDWSDDEENEEEE